MKYKALLIVTILFSCNTVKVIHPENKAALDYYLHKKVKITGKTFNAKMGAFLQINDSTRVWVYNLDSWPEDYYFGNDSCKTVALTGVLIEAYDLPVFIYKKGEPLRSGIPVPEGTDLKQASHRYLIKNYKWVEL